MVRWLVEIHRNGGFLLTTPLWGACGSALGLGRGRRGVWVCRWPLAVWDSRGASGVVCGLGQCRAQMYSTSTVVRGCDRIWAERYTVAADEGRVPTPGDARCRARATGGWACPFRRSLRRSSVIVSLTPQRDPSANPYNGVMKPTGRPLVTGLAAAGALVALLLRRRKRRPVELGGGGAGPPPAGVREPRRPVQPTGSGAAAVDPTER